MEHRERGADYTAKDGDEGRDGAQKLAIKIVDCKRALSQIKCGPH